MSSAPGDFTVDISVQAFASKVESYQLCHQTLQLKRSTSPLSCLLETDLTFSDCRSLTSLVSHPPQTLLAEKGKAPAPENL